MLGRLHIRGTARSRYFRPLRGSSRPRNTFSTTRTAAAGARRMEVVDIHAAGNGEGNRRKAETNSPKAGRTAMPAAAA